MESYGSRAENWPDEERPAVEALLASSADCREILAAHRPLDDLLDTYNPAESSIKAGDILVQLKPSWSDRITNWLMPLSSQDIWRPALLASLPLSIGILVGSSNILTGTALYPTTTNWEEEIYVLALSEETDMNLYSVEDNNE